MHEIWAVVSRHLIVGALFFLPRSRRIATERRLRGKEEYRKLQLADWVLMSWGKSGRTWFRVMLSRFYQVKHGLPVNRLLEFDNLHRMQPLVPKVLFSHNNYMRDYLKKWDNLDHFLGKKVVLLVRDPRDVAVSQFFQWKYRMRPHKKLLNEYPPHGADIGVWDFVTNPACGVPRILAFFNGWARALPRLGGNVLIIRYEDMRRDPAGVMRQVVDFVGTPGTPEEIEKAVEFASYDNMKKLEESRSFKGSGARVRPGDKKNPNSFKVRRAKVGGYRDYFEDEQVAEIDRMVEQGLDPVFGYGTDSSTTAQQPHAGQQVSG
ncbi:MAG: sulfotransferase domain-containing protein [Thiogranum sp.]